MSPFFIVGFVVWVFVIGIALYEHFHENGRKPAANRRRAKRNPWLDG